jgi:hypothetical protein
MTLYSNTAEGGSNGVIVSTSNSGGASGDAWTGKSGNPVFSNSQAKAGVLSYDVAAASTAYAFMYWTWSGSPTDSAAARAYLRMTALTDDGSLIQIRNASAAIASVGLDATGKLYVSQSSFSKVYTIASALSLNTWYRVELTATKGTGTADGVINFALYEGDSLTTVDSYSSSVRNTGTTQLQDARFGKLTSTGTWGSTYLDDLAAQTGSASFIGPSTSTPAAVVYNRSIVIG